MTTVAARLIDVGRLPTLVSGRSATVWWAMMLMIAIEATVFATLIASYFYLRLFQADWPPPGVDPPELLLPTLNTLVLLVSSAFMSYGDRGMMHGNVRKLLVGLSCAVGLAVLFLVLKAIEYSHVSYFWSDHAYGSIVWLIIGFHSLHVLSLVLKSLVIGSLAWHGYFDERRYVGVQINGIYWHFVVLVWVPLYFVLYWSPRLM